MATAKKTAKPAAPKAKRAPSKATKTTTTRIKPAAPKRAVAKSSAQSQTFFTFRATHETVYWLVLGVVVVLMAIWVLTLTIRVQNLYDQIEVTNATNSVSDPLKAPKQ